MPTRYRLTIASRLDADAATVWAHASSIAGVNAELAPLHMSAPAGAVLDERAPLGTPAFVSVVSLWRVVPIDLHELTLVAFEPGRSFHECSRSLLQRRWEHVRHILPEAGGGCVVTDEVTFRPRAFGPLVRPIIARVFERRHRALRASFAGREAERPCAVVARI
jgi:ligand-binding SRPBCC domain-containing protein